MLSDANFKQAARLFAGAQNNTPVGLLEDATPPRIAGRSYYWTTPAGTPVRYPNAYGWPTVYHSSTRVVVAGKRWLERHPLRRRPDGLYTVIGSRRTIHGIQVERVLGYGYDAWVVTRGRRMCHVWYSSSATPRGAVKGALRDWREQARDLKRFTDRLTHRLEDIQVTADHAVASGSCLHGVERFISRHNLRGMKSIPANELLALEYNCHVRRAVLMADRGEEDED